MYREKQAQRSHCGQQTCFDLRSDVSFHSKTITLRPESGQSCVCNMKLNLFLWFRSFELPFQQS